MRKMTMPNFCINFQIKQRNRYQFYTISLSHPTWMRGLKPDVPVNDPDGNPVASYMDAWIKTLLLGCGRIVAITFQSHPSRVRGLKSIVILPYCSMLESHPFGMCGLKYPSDGGSNCLCSRILRGCVD